VLKVFEDRAHPQRKGVEECPAGAVFVVDSRGDPRAASAGGILLTRLMRRGCAGAVTDGGFRDTPEIARMDFAVYHARPSAPTNLIHHHAVDLNVPIGCGGVAVYPGDIMVGDGEGVACIPAAIAEDVASEAFEQTVYEDFVQENVDAGAGLFGLYPMLDPAVRERFQAWRKAKGR
jgi:regulator of RNase E activity RraA